MRVGRGKVFSELMSEEEDDISGLVEGEGGGEIRDAFGVEIGGGGKLDGMESGPRHVDAMEGVEIG